MADFKSESVAGFKSEWVADFRRNPHTEHGRCAESGDFKKGNAAHDRMIAALADLRQSTDRGELALIELLTHPSGWVRLYAATHLLPLRVELASRVLEDLSSGPQSEIEFSATMVLREWAAGKLYVP